MLNLPTAIIDLLQPFAPHFRRVATWEKAKILVIGTILTPGKRTVTSALRVVGMQQVGGFNQYHHVLSRAVWSPLALAQTLLLLLLATFSDPNEPLVFALDETIERRWGRKIAARGIYRDAVRSSKSHFVKTSGLRWISLMLLTPVPWAQRVWALPFMTVLSPSARYYQQRGRQPLTLLRRAEQMLRTLRRWLPDCQLVVVGDNTYAALAFLAACQQMDVTVIARLRMDAALYEPAPPYAGRGRPRKKGKRLPTLARCLIDPDTSWQSVKLRWYNGLERDMQIASATAVWFHNGKTPVPIRWILIRDPQGEYDPLALLCTDPQCCPVFIAQCFVMRWQAEVTFEEVRRHLGVETQRQWSPKAIARTTPVLLGLFSWITLAAHALQAPDRPLTARPAAWYAKALPTFSDAIAIVRQSLWSSGSTFRMSHSEPDMIKIPHSLFDTLVDTLCFAA